MKLVLTVLCRDEADIISEMLEFHLQSGVDQILVTDNASRDATPEILARYAATGRVQVLHQSAHTHDQATWVSEMAELAWRNWKADWILHSDADEFWWCSEGDLKTCLQTVPSGVQALRVGRSNFLPPPSASSGPFHQCQTLRERCSHNALGKPLPPKVCHRGGAGIWVEDGNHGIRQHGQPVPAEPWSSLEILHFPVRSLEQYERKIRQGAEALNRNTRLNPAVGATWRHLQAELNAQGSLSASYRALARNRPQRAWDRLTGNLLRDRRLQRFFARHGR